MREIIELEWKVGPTQQAEDEPEQWVAAMVPGAVQLDWARAKGWEPYWKGERFRDYAWMEDQYWVYETHFEVGAIGVGEELAFVCGGVDYAFEAWLNGRPIWRQVGMHTPVDLPLAGVDEGQNCLRVVVSPAPKLHRDSVDHTQADRSCKPPVSYGWDWHPRLVPLGIWKEAHLERRPRQRIADAHFSYRLTDDFSRADFALEAALVEPAEGSRLRWKLRDPRGAVVWDGERPASGPALRAEGELGEVKLWWPRDHGSPDLYRLELELLGADGRLLDQESRQVGFRRVRLVMYEGAWDEPKDYPKSRWDPPITLEVNGRAIFVKGTNWVNPEIFPGIIDMNTYKPLLEKACLANFNLLRCWGGAIVNKESFFDLCDEMGLLVWQEFTQACLPYEATDDYLATLDQESKSILKQVRKHPCLAIWSGGNELFAAWSRMTDQSLALRLLNKNCLDLDPLTPFIPTAPIMGMAHGDYRFRDHEGREVYQIFGGSNCTAYTEFGVPAPSSVKTLRSFMPEDQLFPPRRGTSWESHHAFGAWHGDTKSWLLPWVIEHYFGKSGSLEDLVERGQWLQSEGYKAIYEEARRQKPRCSMALNWCYNEPWPCAANNSLIAWPLDEKPALAAVGQSCRPQLASARLPKFSWHSSDYFELELWVLNDRYEKMPPDSIRALLKLGDEEVELGRWQHEGVAENRNLQGPTLKLRLPESECERMEVRICSDGNSDLDSVYHLRFLA